MARCLKILNISMIIFCTSLFLCCDFCFACVFESGQRKYDLSALDWPNWQAVGKKNGSDLVLYDISICKPLKYSVPSAEEACANSSVCKRSGGIYTEMGKFTTISNISIYDGVMKGGFMLFLTASSPCPPSSETQKYHVIINFMCGPTLGSPKVLMESDCGVQFLWKTSAACKTPPERHGVPCYVIDNEGNKISLERLALLPAKSILHAYKNQTATISIRICSDVTAADRQCKNCPPGTSAYRTLNGETQVIGQLSSGLELTEEGVQLTYGQPTSSQVLPEGCPLPPTTTVAFRCPERLKSQRPQVISDVDCQYEILWETEHACPQSMLKGDFKTCKFTKIVHGVDLDLSPLRKDKGYYEVNGTLGTKDLSVFFLNVCGGLGEDFNCSNSNWASNAVCLKTADSSEVIGSTSHASLMLVEQRLSLRYEGPECHEGKSQLTVISFSCNPNAKNYGAGYPAHILSDHCTNFFFWETKYACLPHKQDTPCSTFEGNKFFDLSRLRKASGHVWNVLFPRGRNSDNHSLYLMNVCGPVSGPMNDNFPKCEGDPAVSRIEDVNKCVNLGEFTSSPSYDQTTQTIRMEYKNGSICHGNLRWSSIVEFKCYPGLFNSDVILTHVNEAGCVTEFEFRSAIACPSTSITGKDCRLMDPDTGLNIDLSILNSSVYEVTGIQHKFYLSVCGSLPSNNTCTKLLNSSQEVAACAVSLNQSDPMPQNLGAPSSLVNYQYGSVNIKYVSDPSSDNNHTSFRTIILFICSINADKGMPVLSKRVRNTYVFHWYTNVTCPKPASTECIVSNPKTGQQYDFSGLSKSEGNWVSYFNEDDKGKYVKRKLYINICRSLNRAPSCDDPDAAACIVTIEGEKETKYLSNVGRATDIPKLLSDDHLQLHYTHGKSCTAHGVNTNYSTVVQFVCSDRDMDGPRFLGKNGKCQYSFLWTTKAACPLEAISVENECVLTDPGTGFTFDLTSLDGGENSYNVTTGNQTYKFNICNPVINGCIDDNTSKRNVSVCEISKDGHATVLGTTDNFTLQYIKGSDLILTYQNKVNDSEEGLSSEVFITLPCDNSVSKAQPKFIESKNQGYYFQLRTPLTCVQEVASCTFSDQRGNDYDLTTLFHSTTNWEVHDQKQDTVYYINFCRPLIRVPGYKCPGGSTGACQISSPQSLGFSLGSQLSVPTVTEDGIVVVRFTGGDKCKSGIRRSALVNLFCSHSQGKLVFLGETSECEFLFSMRTPAACSLMTAMGTDCVVRDPVFGHTFNLNSLKNKHTNASAVSDEYEYFISVCGKLSDFYGACENSGVCQTKPLDPSFSKSLGLPNADLIYSQGILTLSYNFGSLCHEKFNRTAVIKFTCKHPTASVEDEKPYFISEAEDCAYLFEWPTKLACPPFEVSECFAVGDNGHIYDLSDLSLTSDNYYIRNPMSHNQTFVINVCRSVVYSPDSLCPYASASCLLDSSNTNPEKRMLNIGQVTRPPYFENGKLMIKYSTGAPCDLEKGSTAHFMETIIEFICDKQKISSEPQFIGQDVCTYHFTWSTVYACSVNDTVNSDCLVTDPYTGFKFDFSPLKSDIPYVVKTLHHEYFLNVCDELKTNQCNGSSGVCQQEVSNKERSWNTGNANSKLLYQEGVLFLNYSGGDPCHNNIYKRNTIIQFHCGAGPGHPVFLYESSDCTYYFTWSTEYACQSLVHCAVKNGSHLFDLTPLTEKLYHNAESHLDNDNASYYISVCNSLNRIPDVSCPVGSSICRSDSHTGVSVNLGRVEYPPFVDFLGHATIIYTNGSICSSNPNERYKSRIIFVCDPDEYMGYPVLVRIEDEICYYIFEWRTSIICPLEATEIPQSPGCTFSDNNAGIYFDLSGLRKTGSHYEIAGDKEDKFLLNICGAVDEEGCSKSSVCLQNSDASKSSFGTYSSQKFYYDGNGLRVAFTDGDDCPSSAGGKRSAEIIFSCDLNSALSKPKLYKKYSCLAIFKWETNLVCKDIQHPCSFSIGKRNFDIYRLSSLSHNWKTTDSKNSTYYFNLCRGLYKDAETEGCPSNAAICVKQNNSAISLGLIHSMTRSLTDSGELVLTYTSGSTVLCPSVGSQHLTAGSKITLKCGKSWGSPEFVSGPNSNCIFNFVWSTNVVCENVNQDLVYESNGTLHDKRLSYEIDLGEIMNRTFSVLGISEGETYMYAINIGLGYKYGVSKISDDCYDAAVCQTKPGTTFERDIGSVISRRFSVKGSDLHLSLISHKKGCGKNKDRKVTTVFSMRCSDYAGDGIPEFLYESAGCDYIFTWDTNVACPLVHRRVKPITESPTAASHDSSPEEQIPKSSSNAPAVIIAVLSIVLILCPLVYIISNKDRRSAAGAKIRSVFHRVTLPHFRYRRADGEMLILINGTQVNQSGDFKDDDILS